MEKLQQKLDNERLVTEFEQAISNITAADHNDPVFSNIYGLCMWTELQYRMDNEKKLMNAPSHMCDKTCTIKNIKAIVYRRREFIGGRKLSPDEEDMMRELAKYAQGSTMDKAFNTSLFSKFYHVCFPNTCVHLIPSHHCTAEVCPHAGKYLPHDIRDLTHLWACQSTGNIHICGQYCAGVKHVSEKEGDYVCALTKEVLGRQLVNSSVPDHANLLLSNSPYAPVVEERLPVNAQGLLTGAVMEANSKRIRKMRSSAAAAASSVPVWENSAELMLNKSQCVAMCEKLFFSEARQRMEAKRYLDAYQSMWDDILRQLRTRKPIENHTRDFLGFNRRVLGDRQSVSVDGEDKQPVIDREKQLFYDDTQPPPVKLPDVIGMCQARRPTSVYFTNIPMMDKIREFMCARMHEIDTNALNTVKYATAARNHDIFCDAHATIPVETSPYKQADTDNMTAMQRKQLTPVSDMVAQMRNSYRTRNGITAAPAHTTWDSPKWQTRMTNICYLFSCTVIRVWANLNKFASVVPPECRSRDIESFNRIMLALLYMTKKAFSISPCDDAANVFVDTQSPPASNDVTHVTCIPRIDFANLLPSENYLSNLNVNINKMTSTQTCIRKYFSHMRSAVDVSQLQLRLIDVCNEIMTEKGQK